MALDSADLLALIFPVDMAQLPGPLVRPEPYASLYARLDAATDWSTRIVDPNVFASVCADTLSLLENSSAPDANLNALTMWLMEHTSVKPDESTYFHELEPAWHAAHARWARN